ncbi:MAG: hypothetical protein HY648_12780 [Acidobacteria bacterium]|nr:hypothetical protein [Acidobacteriota bacterium]
MKWLWRTVIFGVLCSPVVAQERRVYEGVVELKKQTIGTVILLEITGDAVSGWIRLDKFVPLEGGAVAEDAAEFRVGGNQYRIEERKGKISYSGPDGTGSRYVIPLERLTGTLQELTEERQFSGAQIAVMEVLGRRRELVFGRPALWKRQIPPFENFPRLEELLGREISVWVADSDDRSGRIVVVEEPLGMAIPLKPPKKPKTEQK